jgi:hypothetical protein
MKTPVSTVGILSLLLTLACVSDCVAQSGTNLAAAVQTEAATRLIQPLQPNQQPSRPAAEMVRLAQSGIDEKVMLAFVENSGAFSLTAEHIVLLRDLGVSIEVIRAILQHDWVLISRQSQPVVASAPVSASDKTNATMDAVAGEPSAEPTGASNKGALPEVKSYLPGAQVNTLSPVTTQTADPFIPRWPNGSGPGPQKKKILYPVREPYPVELTAPIVFLDSPSF